MLNKEFIRYLKKKMIKAILHIFWIFPIKTNKISLLNNLSYTYGDSLKYLDIFIHRNYNHMYKVVFPLKKGEGMPNDYDIFVAPNTFSYYKEVITSRIIITNAGGVSYIPKRKNQMIISTWHGGGPYKKTTTDVFDTYWYQKEVQMNCNNIDYLLSSCKYFTELEAKSMGFSANKCVSFGLPRNDILFVDHRDVAEKVRNYYSIPDGKKFILYAPTFRSSGNQSTSKEVANYIDLDIELLLLALKEKYSCDWVCGIRLHPKLSDMDMSGMNVINCTSYPDMQELLCCADAIITDYSSLMWDFSFTYRPIFLYAPDIEKYEKERGFYMPVSEWPYPIAHNNDEMKSNILAFDNDDYMKRVKEHHLVAGSYETGDACAKTVALINQAMK